MARGWTVLADGRLLVTAVAVADDSLPATRPDSLFPCLLWDHTGSWSHQQQMALARSLIDRGCRYAVCAGLGADNWHIAFDEAFVDKYDEATDAERVAKHVMTTSHPDETLDEVAFYFTACTNFAQHDFQEYVLVHIGEHPARASIDTAVGQHLAGRRAP